VSIEQLLVPQGADHLCFFPHALCVGGSDLHVQGSQGLLGGGKNRNTAIDAVIWNCKRNCSWNFVSGELFPEGAEF
jgi:hypothetical protein